MSLNNKKCVLVGDGGAGKTTWVKKITENTFVQRYVPTLGVEVTPLTLEHPNNQQTNFDLWDTAGQEKFGGQRQGYYTQADCAIVFFDLSSRISFRNVPCWTRDVQQFTDNIVLVGLKSDCTETIKVKNNKIAILVAEFGYLGYYSLSNRLGTQEEALEPFTPLV